jgi:hypothetical protein
MKINVLIFSALLVFLLGLPSTRGESGRKIFSARSATIPILLYHRFGPVATDPMTVTTAVFKSQLQYLSTNGYVIISLRQLVDYYLGKRPTPPTKSLVLTADDGHKSVYTDMFPLLKQYRFPATLFRCSSVAENFLPISAAFAVCWNQQSRWRQ